MPSLEQCKKLAVFQAKKKKWNNSKKWLNKKFKEEVKEFQKAVKKKSPEDIVKEFSDIIIVGSQICHNEAKRKNLDKVYVEKIKDNYKNKKKTWDDKLGKVVRK